MSHLQAAAGATRWSGKKRSGVLLEIGRRGHSLDGGQLEGNPLGLATGRTIVGILHGDGSNGVRSDENAKDPAFARLGCGRVRGKEIQTT